MAWVHWAFDWLLVVSLGALVLLLVWFLLVFRYCGQQLELLLIRCIHHAITPPSRYEPSEPKREHHSRR